MFSLEILLSKVLFLFENNILINTTKVILPWHGKFKLHLTRTNFYSFIPTVFGELNDSFSSELV